MWVSTEVVSIVLQALQSLLANSHVQMEPYLHQLMPAVLTCLVGKKLGLSPTLTFHVRTCGRARCWKHVLCLKPEEAVQLAAAVCHRIE